MGIILAVRIRDYFFGYAVIKIQGINLEQFINLAIMDNIFFWNIERIDFTVLKASVSLRDYKRLRDVRRKTNCKISIIERKGYPFLLHRIFKRKALIAGGVTAIIIMYFLTSFVWVVEIEGNEKITDERIIKELEKAGLAPGAFKPFIDTKDIETKLIIGIDQLIWAGVNVLGTRAIVDIVERIEPPLLIDKSIPYNIVAKKDGIIVDTYIFEGQGRVKTGDTVQAGQVLISGIMEEPDRPPSLVHAMGRVEARTWYKLSEEQPLKLVERERTGQVERAIFLRAGARMLRLSPRECRFSHYDTVTSVNGVIRWRNITSPIEIIVEKYYEVKVKEELISINAATEHAVNRAAERLAGMLPQGAEITGRDVKRIVINDQKVRAEVLFETLEDIALEEKIDINLRED